MVANHPHTLAQIDPESLERGIRTLVSSYQETRSALIAWFVVHYTQALCSHPDFEGSDEERCAWHRTSSQWRWLAQKGRHSRYTQDAA